MASGNRHATPMRFASRLRQIAPAIILLTCLSSALANNPIPTVVGPVVPQAVVPGSGAFTLKVYGANFVSGAVVNWNRSPRSTTFISARELQAQILASDVATAAAGYITVTNPPPGGGVSSAGYAIVEVHKPTKTMVVDEPRVYVLDAFYTITADIYGDGKLDLVTGEGSGTVALNRGNGDGTFQAATIIGGGYFANAGIAPGDFNNEGRLDLVFGVGPKIGEPPTYLKVLLGEGDKKFRGLPRFDYLINDFARGFVVGDFDSDGDLDFASSDDGGISGGSVFHGNGDGTFKKVGNFSKGGGDLVEADFNGDGKLDLVAEYGTGLYIFLGNGDGTFQKARRIATDKQYASCASGPTLLVNDFNSDGNADIAFCDDHAGRIGILLGNGDGGFQPPVYYSTDFGAGAAFGFTAGDFNSDGKTDLVALTTQGPNAQFAVFWGNGDGTFQEARKISLPENGGADKGIVVGDFNSDGLLDFVMVGTGVGNAVYIQK
jgi:hypothetical protein